MSSAAKHASFFRQSGWLMFANVAGGAMMWGVHFLNRALKSPGEYSTFGALLTILMLLPTMPLQMVLAQQTAKELALGRRKDLAGVIRAFLIWSFVLWLAGTVVVLCLQGTILNFLHMTNPLGLWITLVIVLLSVWSPMFVGVLQGKQDFLWVGWAMLAGAFSRISFAALAVWISPNATGMMVGVFLGFLVGTVISGWQSRSVWLGPSEPFDGRSLLRQVVPLTLAFFGFQILFTVDTLLVRYYFPTRADYYVSAGTLSRALMWLVLPLATVMFPRLVHSAAKSEKSNLQSLVLIGTGILAVVGAVSLSLLGPWVIRIPYPKEYVSEVMILLPWYASAMIPLALANVMLNNLLSRPASKLGLAAAVFVLAGGYVWGLTRFHGTPVMILQTMCVCNTLLLALCAAFTWLQKTQPQQAGA